MAGEGARAIEAEVFGIAEGRERAECLRRARQVFDGANETRARYRSIIDFEKRVDALIRAYAWADVVWFFEESGAETFTEAAYLEESAPCECLWCMICRPFRVLRWLNPFPMVRTVREIMGGKPLQFAALPADTPEPIAW